MSKNDAVMFYAYYKLAVFGNCDRAKPSIFNIIEYMKYNAWMSVSFKGITKEKAMQKVVDDFKKIAPTNMRAKL